MTFAERARLYAAPALEKGLDLLEALAAEDSPQSQADLARLLRRSPNEIFRMLDCLERRGFIAKEETTGRYRLTLRLYELAHTHTPVDHLLRAAERPMRDLSRELGESCHLSVLSEGRLLVLAQVESQKRTRLSVEVGSRFPVVRTASGRVLLGALQQEDLDDLLTRDEEFRRMGAAERRVFLTRLLEVRRSGVYAGRSDLTQGVRDVAALVGNPRVKVSAALCVPFLTVVGRPRPVVEIRAAVVRTAETITRHLGLTGKR